MSRRMRSPILVVVALFMLASLAMALVLNPRVRSFEDLGPFVTLAADALAFVEVSLLAVWLALGVRTVSGPWRLLGTWVVIFAWSRLLRILAPPVMWQTASMSTTLMLVFQAVGIVAVLSLVRYRGYALADSPRQVRLQDAGPKSFQFDMGELMFATAVVAIICSSSIYLVHFPMLRMVPTVMKLPLWFGFWRAVATLAAVWFMLGTQYRIVRWLVLIGSFVGLIVAEFVSSSWIQTSNVWMPGHLWQVRWHCLNLVILEMGLLLAGLWGVRLSGLRFVRREEETA